MLRQTALSREFVFGDQDFYADYVDFNDVCLPSSLSTHFDVSRREKEYLPEYFSSPYVCCSFFLEYRLKTRFDPSMSVLS
jgi:hypothetical protein